MDIPCDARKPADSTAAKSAHSVLRGQSLTPDAYETLVRELKREQRFGLAREVLARARAEGAVGDKRTWFRQQHALCTYKDLDLPTLDRLDRAEEILSREEDLTTTTDQESLGLAGAIAKRRWEADGRKEHLEKSLHYRLRAHEQGLAGDQGYNGVNAAFLLDLLAHLEEREAVGITDAAEDLRARAGAIRHELIQGLPDLPDTPDNAWVAQAWFYYATLAEAHFGLGAFDEAARWLKDAEEKGVDAEQWERHTASLQFADLARLRRAHEAARKGMRPPSAEQLFQAEAPDTAVLRLLTASSADQKLADSSAEAALSAYVGKVGLALSGGGFRASLYHIGVLARLAELDVLRHVEVLSCVSGGSILGAHYYLEVQRLLQEKPQSQVTRADYVDIVKRLERDFVAGVQENVRVRVASSFWKNLRMIFTRGYSRTHRVGELYEECLYKRVQDGKGDKARYMTDLFVKPKDDPGFSLKSDNWRRKAKVPELILNATALNTGHNWQFTASWMGEPPGAIDHKVSGVARLRRMYYGEAPPAHRCVRLGTAVGASSCVPGLFEPVSFEGLYPDRILRLVDGGVHDNQGTVSLLERDCRVLLVSDASGQLGGQADPSISLLGPLLRSNGILQARVREEQYDEVDSRIAAGHLRGAMIVHLKSDLDPDPVDWEDCDLPRAVLEDPRPPRRRRPLTEYGILKTVQAAVGEIRTDLDAFHQAEAYALMTSGYCMTEKYFDDPAVDLPADRTAPAPEEHARWKRFGDWDFLSIKTAMSEEADSKTLLDVLAVSSQLAFKAWRLDPVLKAVSPVLKGAAAVAALLALWLLWDWSIRPAELIVSFLVTAALAAVFGKRVLGIVQFRSTVRSWLRHVGVALGGFLIAKIHLWLIDPRYLKAGKLDRVSGRGG